MTVFDKRYANDETGRPAYDPRILLKVISYGYYKGIISSRALAEACRRNVVFMEELELERRKQSEAQPEKRKLFVVQDFLYDEVKATCICPADDESPRHGSALPKFRSCSSTT